MSAIVPSIVLGGCEEEQGNCLAACVNAVTVQLNREAWPDGERSIVVRYEDRGSQTISCQLKRLTADPLDVADADGGSVDLGEDEPTCDTNHAWLDMDRIGNLTLRLDNTAPAEIEIDVVDPDGTVHTETIAPEYTRRTLCGQTCSSGESTVRLLY